MISFHSGRAKGVTLTVTDFAPVLPPGPEQDSIKITFGGGRGTTTSLPFSALEPLQAPEAVQEVVKVDDQVNVVDWPSKIEVGNPEKLRVGGQYGVVTLRVLERLVAPLL